MWDGGWGTGSLRLRLFLTGCDLDLAVLSLLPDIRLLTLNNCMVTWTMSPSTLASLQELAVESTNTWTSSMVELNLLYYYGMCGEGQGKLDATVLQPGNCGWFNVLHMSFPLLFLNLSLNP